MSSWKDAKVTGTLRKSFELATHMSWLFDDDKVRTAYVMFAAMYDEDSGISKAFSDMETRLLPSIAYIMQDKEVFVSIFGEKAAEKFYKEQDAEEQENTLDDTSGVKFINAKDFGLDESDEVTGKMFDVLNSMLQMSIDDAGCDEGSYIMEPCYSDKLETACEDAYIRCRVSGKDYIDLDTVVYSLLTNKESSAYRFVSGILSQLNVNPDDFINGLKFSANIPGLTGEALIDVTIPAALETCLENLNLKYSKGEECTILGRDKEIFKAFNIFSKKTKRNAVLVGLPGVGKTAIIEAIAQHIVNETCPKEFFGYTVLSLDVNSMIAGTKYRGEFETKVAILKQFLENTPKVILFVDEMHQMLGAGGTSEGTVDLSGSLKPILSRDDVVFVGATTINEYEQILSRDGAFKRRFEVITIREPKNDEVKGMIKAKLKKMEEYHGVKMPAKLLDYIILCSNCFNLDNANPDKTLDLCDRSMAIAKMRNKKHVTKADINMVYEECFKLYENISEKDIQAVAYHEVGHFIVTRLTKEREAHTVTAISIVPGDGFLGVNIIERKEGFVSADKEYAEAYIMSLLAGRVAQEKISKHIDSGARSDLKKAKSYAKELIAEYGMDDSEEFKNVYLMDDDLFNEQLAAKIDEKANQLIKRLYAQTEVFINAHWDEIDKMAKYLIENKIVTSDELEQFIVK